MPDAEFHPERILEVLAAHDVRAVLIGGFAAVIYGSPYVTTDVDLVPDPDGANMARLSAALRALHARIWTASEPGGLPFEHSAASLSNAATWNLVTDFGRMDLTFAPAGTSGYADLARDAVHLKILGAEVDVASLADVIRSKEASSREKDRLVLPVLRRLLDEGGG
jgi:hypothetical protein